MLEERVTKSGALRFIVLLGFVSLFADMTYEGARSITGPFLQVLGASATVVGIVAGLGELIGYALRLATGYLSDRIRKYWLLTIIGYTVNLLAVPALALTNRWQWAAALIVTERLGKAIRTPARDAMLSHATALTGHGAGFGLHEAMDQIGAVAGPLLLTLLLSFKDDYQRSFGFLLIPALLALATLAIARLRYPEPAAFEPAHQKIEGRGFSRTYWIYLVSAALIAAGYADFPLIAFHLKKHAITEDQWIPLLYSIAMGVDALAALLFGRLFDRAGFLSLTAAVFLSAFFAPLAFGFSLSSVVAGMVLWGIGMGAQESIIRAAVARMIPSEKRGTAYGIFNAAYGIAWFAGSALMGRLYDVSITALILFSMACQWTAIAVLLKVRKELR